MRANTTPMMLAMVILILRPKVMTRIPKLMINGESKPKDCPKFSQDNQDTSCAIVPINPPHNPRQHQKKQYPAVFSFHLLLPLIRFWQENPCLSCYSIIETLSCIHFFTVSLHSWKRKPNGCLERNQSRIL